MIRLTGGTLRGRVLPGEVPEGVRPSGSRGREALFNLLGQDLTGFSWLDLTGGTGLVALEALSRGASPVSIVEKDSRALGTIQKNVAALGVAVNVVRGDAMKLPLAKSRLVFLDPPYKDAIGPWLDRAATLAEELLVAEARGDTVWPDVGGFHLEKARRYGDTAFGIYRRGIYRRDIRHEDGGKAELSG